MTKIKNKIPKFNSIQDEALFWDTHDTTQFEDEFTPVRVRFAKNLSEGITVRFDPETLSALRTAAKEHGLGTTALIRMWAMEKLKKFQLSV